MAQANQPQKPRQMWRKQTIRLATGLADSTIYRHIAQGLFTKPVHIGGGRSAWPADEVQKIQNARIAGASDDDIRELVVELHEARGASCH